MNVPAKGSALEELSEGRATQLHMTSLSSYLWVREVTGMQTFRDIDIFVCPAIKSALI